jgi:phosphoglycerate dehydrogenase-like enzyme
MLYQNVGTLDPWEKEPRKQFSQNTLLIIGFGKIGARVASLLKPFMQISTYDIFQNEIAELKPMFQQADCITIHIPKSDENVSFIDAEKMSWMKNNSVLVNTARGVIVDEEALYNEIKSGRLRAAFDVYWQEPYRGKLKEFYPDRFYMTPHVASTCSSFLKGCRDGLDQLIDIIKENSKR